MISMNHKKIVSIVLLSIALLLWSYHFTRIEIEFPESHIDGLLVCSPEYNPRPWGMSEQEQAATIDAYIEQLDETLAASTNTDARVMAAVRRNDFNVANRIDELADLITQDPDNRLANLHFLNACTKIAEHPACDADSVVRANTVNGNNAVSWSLLAVYRSELGDNFGVDRAMARAANAPEFDDYFGTQLRIMRDAMPSGSEHQQMRLAWTLMFWSNLTLNNGSQVAYLCSNDDPLRAGLLRACLDFGERMQLESQSLIMTMVGGGIQQTAYGAMGNVEEANRLEQEHLAFQRNRSAPDSLFSQFHKVSSLMSYDVDLALYWMDNFIEFGETETAMANIVAEGRRLSADPDYAPCRSPGPRIYYR